jgi:hypothetical protein
MSLTKPLVFREFSGESQINRKYILVMQNDRKKIANSTTGTILYFNYRVSIVMGQAILRIFNRLISTFLAVKVLRPDS